ncbi:F-box protein FBW2-like [Prosopis cineraria]|uniref:F-box protein FBW2-like n=1 Tax=Prosopis cineraria TaxID=364024 RepID=UPI00240EE8E4|nr:F-box protein FBW2-like [Prosopis cineraria]XP_054815813.1 F-box protein FBW2-like [Prosopis cineraria]XP_054815814.1 F-box protein FBW2-like [Prosopis cineraria]
MAAASEYPRWDGLIADALVVIFCKVSLLERLAVIPRVCKSWAKVVSSPHCWQEIDILNWSCFFQPPGQLERMLQMLVARSSGSLHKFCVSGLQSDYIFPSIADHAGCLHTLCVPGCNISDSMMEEIAGRLSSITFLDVSNCLNLTANGIEVIGKNCKLLERFCRNMNENHWVSADKPSQDDEALAIAATMPNLKHLEMTNHVITSDGVRRILCACPKLEFLDLRGFQYGQLGDFYLQNKFPNLTVLWEDSPSMGSDVGVYYDCLSDDDENLWDEFHGIFWL